MLLSEVRKCPCSGLQAGKGGGVSKSWWLRWLVGPTGPESPCAAGSASQSAHFLPRAKTECLEAWGPGEIGAPGASPSQITSGQYVCSGWTWLSIGTTQLLGPHVRPPGQLHSAVPGLLTQEKLTSLTVLQTGVLSLVSICLRPPITTLTSA